MKRFCQFFGAVIAIILFNGLLFSQSKYSQFGNLNHGAVDVGATWTKLNTVATTHTFTKSSGDTTIEVYVNSRFSVGSWNGPLGVQFQVRVDDSILPTFSNAGSILKSNNSEFLSIVAVFQNLPAGSHTVSIWAHATPTGSATSVMVDPGGWGGKIIVKETM